MPIIHICRCRRGFKYGPSQSASQSQKLVPGIWNHVRRRRGAKNSFLRPLRTREKKYGFIQGPAKERIRKWRLRGLRGGGERSPRRKGKAFFSGDARSRGVLPTWALAIGQAQADVPSAAWARTAARAAPPWKLERRARSRGLPRPRSPPANPLLQSLFAPN